MVKDAKSHANVKKAEEPNGKELVIGSRVYSDLGGPDQKQGWFSWIVAVTTMTIYCGWMNILLLLCIAAIFNPWIRCVFFGSAHVSTGLPCWHWSGLYVPLVFSEVQL